jgi:hypothetical protein
MTFLVVCGLADTIDIFSPSIAFNRVDLPALGRPTMVTNPDLNFFSSTSFITTG